MKLYYLNTVKFFLPVLFLLLLVSCFKDKSNYNYKPYNKITVTDPKVDENSGNVIYLSLGDTLKLNPTINQTIPTTKLSYKWFTYMYGGILDDYNPRDTISQAPNADLKITADPFTVGEYYRLILEITDDNTGVTSYLAYVLYIQSKYSFGYVFLEQKGSGGEMSMIFSDGSIDHSVYSTANPTFPLGKPISFRSTPFSVKDGLSTAGYRFYIATEGDGMQLDYKTLSRLWGLDYLFLARPAVIKPSYIGWTASYQATGFTANLGIIINDGLLYPFVLTGKKWGGVSPTWDNKYDYNIAPYVAGATAFNAPYQIAVYDNKYKRFYNVTGSTLSSFPDSASASGVFNLNNTGLDMVYMDSTNVPDTYNAIMKDASNTPYLLGINLVPTIANPIATLRKVAMNAPGIINATGFASSTTSSHIFYGLNNTIYRYEVTSNSYTQLYTLGAGETITKMRYESVAPDVGKGKPRLTVATWNGTEGKVYFFTISETGDIVGGGPTNTFGGFGKIVDMTYKYP